MSFFCFQDQTASTLLFPLKQPPSSRIMIITRVLFTLATLSSYSLAQTTTADAPPPWQTGVITEDGTCGSGSPDAWVCTPTWGACCSKDGICGRSKAYCGEGW